MSSHIFSTTLDLLEVWADCLTSHFRENDRGHWMHPIYDPTSTDLYAPGPALLPSRGIFLPCLSKIMFAIIRMYLSPTLIIFYWYLSILLTGTYCLVIFYLQTCQALFCLRDFLTVLPLPEIFFLMPLLIQSSA